MYIGRFGTRRAYIVCGFEMCVDLKMLGLGINSRETCGLYVGTT